MKKLLLLLGVILLSINTYAQSTTVSATITDGDSLLWTNATCTAQLTPGPNAPALSQYGWTGGSLATYYNPVSCTTNGSGAFSISLPTSGTVSPTGSFYVFTVCPAITNGVCFKYNTQTTGSTQSLTTALSAAAGQPRITGHVLYGYGTVEAASPVKGDFFYTTGCNQYTGSAYGTCASSSGGSYLLIANNLSDVASAATSRTNIGAIAAYENHSGLCASAATQALATGPTYLGNSSNCAGAFNGAFGQVIGITGTLKNLACSSAVIGNNANDGVCTVYVGTAGVYNATALTCTIGVAYSCVDTTHTASVTAGQLVSVRVLPASTGQGGTSLADISATVAIQQ
jgi:hypothetical protein